MSIHADLQPTLTELARCRVICAQGLGGAHLAARLEAIAQHLEEIAQRVAALEGSNVPRHWRGQGDPTAEDVQSGRVVLLAAAKQQRAVTQAVRL